MGKGKKYSEEEILDALKEVDAGASTSSVAETLGVSERTVSRWRERVGQKNEDRLDEIRALQEENQRLKRIVARQALEIDAYREATDGSW